VPQAVKSLADREGTSESNIGFVSILDNSGRCETGPHILTKIESWAKSKGIDVVVWTNSHSFMVNAIEDFPVNVKCTLNYSGLGERKC